MQPLILRFKEDKKPIYFVTFLPAFKLDFYVDFWRFHRSKTILEGLFQPLLRMGGIKYSTGFFSDNFDRLI